MRKPSRAFVLLVLLLPLAIPAESTAVTPDVTVGPTLAHASPIASAVQGARGERPNIVLILTDDQNPQSTTGMPELQSQISRNGVNFTNALATTPTCCPARATLFTGTYPQTNNVWTNWLPNGGWEIFHEFGWDDKTFAVELDKAGYFTAYIGRYMNGYAMAGTREALTGSRDYIPPGWDSWISFGVPSDVHDGQHQGYYDYWLMSRSTPESDVTYELRGATPSDYSTDVFNELSVEAIHRAPREEPLLLVQSVWAPHKPFVPAPRHADAQVKVDVPRDINNVKGKPPWIVAQLPLKRAMIKRVLTNQARALLSVDDGIRAITQALRDTGRLSDTLFVFASDNGLVQGRFRINNKKNYPYAAPIPLMMRWDSAPHKYNLDPGTRDDRLTTLADIYPTVLEAANIPIPDQAEGQSLLSRGSGPSQVLLSAWRNQEATRETEMPSYCGLRTERWLYVRYTQGIEELYDVEKDPLFRRNQVSTNSARLVLDQLRKSTREMCLPTPPDFVWGRPPPSG